jgi:hypothetical protein
MNIYGWLRLAKCGGQTALPRFQDGSDSKMRRWIAEDVENVSQVLLKMKPERLRSNYISSSPRYLLSHGLAFKVFCHHGYDVYKLFVLRQLPTT